MEKEEDMVMVKVMVIADMDEEKVMDKDMVGEMVVAGSLCIFARQHKAVGRIIIK